MTNMSSAEASLSPSSGEMSSCGICLDEFEPGSMYLLQKCKCSFCRNCLVKYFEFMIDNGHLHLHCPSYKCMLNNEISPEQIESLISEAHNAKYQVLLNNKVLNDFLAENQSKIRCPFCDQIFDVNVQSREANKAAAAAVAETTPTPLGTSVKCPSCLESFCATCHLRLTNRKDNHICGDLNEAVLNDLDIKKCPNCNYLIQREGGCAQIYCRNCSHVFCWHCLKSLDNDFLLFHYDSGPCKNKLGHSRLSIFFNRVQTISICLGISILMILASPVILMTLPCLITSKCRLCRRHRKRADSQV